MKRIAKLIVIISLSVAALGLVFLVAGQVMGATAEEAEKLLGTASYVKTVEEKVVKISDSDDITYSDGYQAECLKEYAGIYKLEAEVTEIELQVKESSDENLRIRVDGMPEKVKNAIVIQNEGDELEIELKPGRTLKNWMKNAGDNGTMIIELPKGRTMEEMSFTIGAGALTAEQLEAEKLEIEVGAGAVRILQFHAEKMKVECGAGEAELDGTVTEKLEIECGVGEVAVHDSGRESDYDYNLQCGIGELQIGESSYSGIGHKKRIQSPDSTKEMEIECGIGD